MAQIIIVSNRLPVTVRRKGGRPTLAASTGGVATGLGAYHEQAGGVWVGWPGPGQGWSAHHWAGLEAEMSAGGFVPVALSAEDESGFYAGFSNGVLWPLCHYLLDRIPLDAQHWDTYQRVNRRFADEVVRVHRPGDIIWVNDYHLMLVPGLIRAQIPDARIAYFHHIPFPSTEVFRTLPWHRSLLEGLLGADLIGVHTDSYVRHLRFALRHGVGADLGTDGVQWNGRRVAIGAYPMGIDAARFAALADEPTVCEEAARIRLDAGGRTILLGVDRLDYTKGIPRRLLAFERLLSREPSLRGRVRLIQVAVPSRGDVPAYRTFRQQVEAAVGRINGQFGTVDSAPVHYLHRTVSETQLVALYRAADAMIVSPLRDGMNLVAKEFVASRTDVDGVLLLSEFAGASEDLREAVLINPYDIDGVADAMHRAIRMERPERQARMRALRRRVMERPVERWATGFVSDLVEATGSAPPARAASDEDAAVMDHVAQLAAGADAVHLFLDYDGTLVPFADVPDLASPDPGLLALLGLVTATPGLTVHLISGRSRDTLRTWFAGTGLSLWAEHGLWYSTDGQTWDAVTVADARVLELALPVLERATRRTPGSSIEHKGGSISWHYRLADVDAGPARAGELRTELQGLAGADGLDVIDGSKVIEVRPHGVHKGLPIDRVRTHAGIGTLFLAIGDDTTDEDMFRALRVAGIGICVGDRPSEAHYRLRDWQAVRHLISRLAAVRQAGPPATTGIPNPEEARA